MREIGGILALISAALFAWVLGSEADEIGFRDLSVFAVALAVILTVQLLLFYLLDKLVGVIAGSQREIILLVAAAVLLGCNAYFLAFYTLELPTGIRIAYSVIVGVVFLVLMSLTRLRPVLRLFAGIMLLISIAQYGYARATLAGSDVSAETVSLPINSKRNVYIIGFESLHSPKAYRENYGIEDPSHFKVLRDAGFRVLERAYSAERATMSSYAAMFEFKRAYKKSDLGKRGVFVDNSTFRSFRESDYRIQFLYKNSYFAVNPNSVDYLFPPPAFDACDELGPFYFYGLCSSMAVKVINEYVLGSVKMGWKPQIPLLQNRTDIAVSSSHPWFTFTHIKYPGHTSGHHRYTDSEYVANYKRIVQGEMPTIAENMRKTAAYVVANDPGAVVIVLGDHGTHLFRGDEQTLKQLVFSNPPLLPIKTILEDQHGITLAVYPASFCENRISEPFSTRLLIEALIACLNGDDAPTAEERRRGRLINFLGELRDIGELRPEAVTQRP